MSIPKVILVPTDFSACSEYALDYAIEIAAKLGAKILVLHAYQVTPWDELDGALVNKTDAGERIVGELRQALDRTVKARNDRGVELAPLLLEGDPTASIHSAAHDASAGMIVMGTHGRRALARALLGSVTETVVRTAACPVLTVHAPAATQP